MFSFLDSLFAPLLTRWKPRTKKTAPKAAWSGLRQSPLQLKEDRSSPLPPSSAAPPKIAPPETASLEKEIRLARKFSLAEAIGREGGSFMKGESAIPRPLRALTTINQFITAYVSDPSGAIATTLSTWASSDIRVSQQLDTPLTALTQIVDSLLSEPTTFCEFSRQVAIAHAHLTGERPYFQHDGRSAHPNAAHTHDSIKAELTALLRHLRGS